MKLRTLVAALALGAAAAPAFAAFYVESDREMKGTFTVSRAPANHVVPAIPMAGASEPGPGEPEETKPQKKQGRQVDLRAEAEKARKQAANVPVADAATAGVQRPLTTAELVRKQAPLPVSDRVRLDASQRWETEGVADALVGLGGQVEYAYGQSRPTISCAPLHICTIQFIPGENITSLSLGDTVRWLAQATTAGERPVVVVKPTQPGIATNMVVTTDAGRVYYMHLVASKTEYVPIVGFYDPAALITDMREQAAKAAEAKAKAEAAAAAAKAKREQAVVAQVGGPGFDPTKLDFGYTCKGEEDFRPARVFSSDTHTYIQMSPEIKAQDAPAVFNMSNQGTELMNTRFDKGYYIVDGKPAKFRLALGVGRDARVVECKTDSQRSRSGGMFSLFGE